MFCLICRESINRVAEAAGLKTSSGRKKVAFLKYFMRCFADAAVVICSSASLGCLKLLCTVRLIPAYLVIYFYIKLAITDADFNIKFVIEQQ